jgi:5-methylcytosine-specific restriction protein A
MARMTARACLICGKPSVAGRSRCKAHGGGAWARTSAASKSRYGAHWREIRARVLAEEPRCRLCGAASADVDHIKAAEDGGTEARENLRALCNPCHRKWTSEQNRERRNRRRQQ